MFPPKTRVLIVDDAATIRAMIKELLGNMGFTNTFEARDVTEAQDSLTKMDADGAPIELVLCDMNMPGQSGNEFLKKTRATPSGKNLPFIMITTEGQMRVVTESVMAGVSAYIIKPVNQQTLSNKMLEAWKKHNPKK